MPASLDITARPHAPFRITFGGEPVAETVIHIQSPWLAGAPTEDLFPLAAPAEHAQGIALYRSGGLLLGHAQEPFLATELAARTESLYRRILGVTRGLHLYRIWNYVPQINAETAGLENYRAFCAGRSLAFEAALGRQFQHQLPSASAVGCAGNRLDVIFVAGEAAPSHFENPEQVPAYLYPPEHGPRSPSFARATVARDGARTWTFISGTSAIKGHQTMAPGAFPAQLDCTVANLRLISQTAGLGDDLGAAQGARRHFKIYLRHPQDLDFARAQLACTLLRPSDVATYLQADICRAALDIEIEATLAT
ncbi:MAG: hypothetical protein V4773_26140 [Verrucomicrobiota bacterium]